MLLVVVVAVVVVVVLGGGAHFQCTVCSSAPLHRCTAVPLHRCTAELIIPVVVQSALQLPVITRATNLGVSVTVSTQGSDFDTVLTVYGGRTLATLQRVASNDDCTTEVTHSCVSFQARRGVQYSLQVMGAYGETGSVTMRAWKGTTR